MPLRRTVLAFVVALVCALAVFTLPRFAWNTVQAAFAHPPMSWRRKTSLRIAIRNQIQITQRKKMHIDQNTSRNG